jgi:hypothetical protein
MYLFDLAISAEQYTFTHLLSRRIIVDIHVYIRIVSKLMNIVMLEASFARQDTMKSTNKVHLERLASCCLQLLLGSTLLCHLAGCDPQAVGGDPDATIGTDVSVDAWVAALDCPAQVAGEYVNDDCGECMDDPTPYRWMGERCVFDPICCTCDGADCGSRFASYLDCSQAHSQCRTVLTPPEFPGARIIWQMLDSSAGAGQAMMLSGEGLVRSWSNAPSGITWSDAEYEFQVFVGQDAANELLGELAQVDLEQLAASLPQPDGDCSAKVSVVLCEGCPEHVLSYATAADLLPSFRLVYYWLDSHFCGHGSAQAGWPSLLPQDYCEADSHHD